MVQKLTEIRVKHSIPEGLDMSSREFGFVGAKKRWFMA